MRQVHEGDIDVQWGGKKQKNNSLTGKGAEQLIGREQTWVEEARGLHQHKSERERAVSLSNGPHRKKAPRMVRNEPSTEGRSDGVEPRSGTSRCSTLQWRQCVKSLPCTMAASVICLGLVKKKYIYKHFFQGNLIARTK